MFLRNNADAAIQEEGAVSPPRYQPRAPGGPAAVDALATALLAPGFLAGFTPQELSNAAWALARLRPDHPEPLQASQGSRSPFKGAWGEGEPALCPGPPPMESIPLRPLMASVSRSCAGGVG